MRLMTQEIEREQRRWERLALEGATAVDDSGRTLGQVIQVSGGGVGVKLNADRRLDDWSAGKRLRVTVQEPSAEHTMTFRVRYVKEGVLGLEFAR
jgi:PilZ domain-containing protein